MSISKKPSKGQKRPPPSSTWRLAPWYPAVSAVGVAIALGLLAKAFAPPIHYLSTYNRKQMQEVFFGKETWAVLCTGGKGKGGSDAVTKRFSTAAKELKGSVKFGLVDCSGTLPSGKNILQKFELSEDVQPVLFVTGAGMTPVQATTRHMETHSSLLKWVQGTAEPRASAVDSTRKLESMCLKKDRCALIMKAGPLEEEAREAFRELMARHRNLRFVSVDAARLETSIEKKVGIRPVEGAHQLLHFTRYNVTDKPKVGTPRWGLQVYGGELEPDAMSIFLEDAARAGEDGSLKNSKSTTNLTRLPTVMARKEPKVKPMTPPPSASRTGSESGDEGAADGQAGSAAEGSDVGSNDGGEFEAKFAGMNRDQLLEEFRRKQKEREAARRKAMDEEADNFFFASDEKEEEDEDEQGFWGFEEEGEGEYAPGSGEEGDEEDDEEIVDLDEM